MGTQADTNGRFSKKRDGIVSAAVRLINQRGVQATTLAAVAREVGLNATSITYYFARKEQLLVAAYTDTMQRMEDMAIDAGREADTPSRLRRFIGNHVALRRDIRSGEHGLLAVLSEVRTLDDEAHATLLAHYKRIVDVVRGYFDAPETYPQHAVNSARAHILMEAMMWFPVWSQRYSTRDFDRIEDRLYDLLAHGMAKPGGEKSPRPLPGKTWRTLSNDDALSPADDFLRAATLTINQLGYRGASVNRIAETLNVTKGSFYHHHETKDDLVVACFAHSYDRLSNVQQAGLSLDADYWVRLISVLYELIDLQFDDPTPLLRTTALQALAGDDRFDVVNRSNRLARRFAGMIIDGIADGSIRAIDPLIASQIIMSTLNGAYEARAWAQRFNREGNAVETYAALLQNGVLFNPLGVH
jgi:AcrR family transcriptional regulator